MQIIYQGGRKSIADKYEYIMHGKLYKISEEDPAKAAAKGKSVKAYVLELNITHSLIQTSITRFHFNFYLPLIIIHGWIGIQVFIHNRFILLTEPGN